MNKFYLTSVLLLLTSPAPHSPALVEEQKSTCTGEPSDLQGLINHELKAGKKQIIIPPGRYRVTPRKREHLRLVDLEDIEIVADGVEMICTETTRAVTIANCRNLTLRGLVIDYDPLPFTQGEIVNISPDGLIHDIELFAGYPQTGEISGQKYEIFRSDTRTLRFGSYHGCEVTKPAPGRIRVTKPDNYRNQYAEVQGCTSAEQIGDIIAIDCSNAPGGSIPHAVFIHRSSQVKLESVKLYASNVFGFFESDCRGNVYRQCVVDRRPTSTDLKKRANPRIRSLNADAFHSKHAEVGPSYIECRAQFQGDDCVAVNGDYHMIMEATGDELRVLAKHNFNIVKGDPVELVSYEGVRLPDATVISVESDGRIDDQERAFLRNQRLNDNLKHNRHNALTTAFRVIIDRSVSLPMGSLICSANRVGNGFKVIDCEFGFNRSRGILVKASKGEIRGNRLENCWMEAIKLAPEYWWLEAGSGIDVVIRNNTITNCRSRSIDVSSGSGSGQISPAGAHRDITIVDNRIENSPAPQILVTSTDGLVITDNTIHQPEDPVLKIEQAVRLKRCKNSRVEGNHKLPTDWPMHRYDPQMTGRTLLKAEMHKAPETVWRYYLGLWNNHLLLTSATEKSATIDLPKTVFGRDYLGSKAISWGLRRPPVDIDGRETTIDLPNRSEIKLAKLLADLPGLQRVEFDNAFSEGAEENRGRLIAYDQGADNPRQIWQTERVKDMYSPVVAIADTDLDGQDEIILLTHYHLAIYDALSGQVKDRVEWNVGRNYGQLDVIDIDGDGRPDFVIQADAPPHLEFIHNTDQGLKLGWSHKYLADEADVAVPTDFQLNNLPNSVCDLDGDGRIELAVNIHDFRQDRRWHVVIFDVMTGEVKSDFVDRYLWAVADLNHDGYFELFLSHAPGKTVDIQAQLFVETYRGNNQTIPQWKSKTAGRFCMQPYFFPNHTNSASSRGPVCRSTVVTGDVDGNGCDEFFVMADQQLLAVGGSDDGYQINFTVDSPSEQPPRALAVESLASGNRVLVELQAESGKIEIKGAEAEHLSHYPAGNFRTTPTVADLDSDGQNEIIVENAGGFIEVIDPVERSSRWKFAASAQPIWVTWKTEHGPVPAVDLDGDGQKEVICCDAGNEPYTTLYALRADGSVYWRSELTGIAPRLTETFSIGYFRDQGWDVIVTIQEKTQPEMLCLDGRTGNVLWHQKTWTDGDGRSWPYPNSYTCVDVDGDGFHQIYGSYAYIYYVLDGKTGIPIRKPINIHRQVFNRWQAYFHPIPADYNGDGKTEFLLASGSYAIGGVATVTPNCEILWEKALDNTIGARGLQGIGDCDGDGIPDVAFYHLDGRIACYDGKTGVVKWQIEDLQNHNSYSTGHFASGDIDSDGCDEFLYPLGSNELIAADFHASNHVLWRVPLQSEPGTPILADIDGDGLAEILVCTQDGYLNILK